MSTARTVVGIVDGAWGVYARLGMTLLDAAKSPWCAIVHQNVLDEKAWVPDVEEPVPGERLIVWSGSAGAGLFERTPETWLPEGTARFEAWLDEAVPRVRGRLLVRPHARHVLCDAHRTASFLDRREDVGLALAPVALLESDMLTNATDHIERALETLGGRCDCVLLQNIRPPETASATPVRTPLHEGMLDAGTLVDLVGRYVPTSTPVVVMGDWGAHRALVEPLLANG